MLLISLLVSIKFSLWPAKKLVLWFYILSLRRINYPCDTQMQWIYNSLMVTLSMYLNLPSCKIQQSFKAQRMFSLSTTFKKCSRKEAGAHYKTCVQTKVARRNHSSASESTSSSKSSSDIESSWRLVIVHPIHVHSCVQRRPISISPSLQSNFVHLVPKLTNLLHESLLNSMNLLFVDGTMCITHKKSEKGLLLLPISSHVGSAATLFVDNMWNVAQLRITSTLDIWRFQCGDGSRLQTILWLQTQWFFQCTWTFSTVLRKMGRTNQRPTSCQDLYM